LPAAAQQPPTNPPGVEVKTPRVQVQVRAPHVESPQAQARPAHHALAVRASEIQGMDVRNPAKEELGSVEDLVINVPQGRIEYAALSFGGFAGIGDKLFAVPWDAMQV